MRILTAAVIMMSLALPVVAQEYRTDEFRSGDSHIGLAYSCAVLGVKTGVAPDAMEIVATVTAQGLTAEHSGDLMTDALDWWDADGERLAAMGMWDEFCAQPIDNFRRLLGK